MCNEMYENVKSLDYTKNSLQSDSDPATMEVVTRTNAYNEFQKIVDEIVQSDIVVLEEYSTENGYDENFDVTDSLSVRDCAYFAHSTVIASGRLTSPITTGGLTQREP